MFNFTDVCVATDLSKPLAFAYCVSPERRAPVSAVLSDVFL